MKVAIVYDRVNKIGGAERVVESLFAIFPSATLYTSVYDKVNTPWAKNIRVKTSFLQKIPLVKNKHEYLASFMPFVFESFDFSNFDVVISVTSEAAKGIIVSTKTKHICICLTPTRYLWSGYKNYFNNFLLRMISFPIVGYLRSWDKKASKRPDVMIAISEVVRSRIKKFYGRDSSVVYPPSDRLYRDKTVRTIPHDDYFLVVSRLVPYKRIDLAVKAARIAKKRLIVIGEGSEYERLDSLSDENTVFLGKVSDELLRSYYKNCQALIFPGEEDFGIVMVEANLAGKPVIAYGKGGAVEIITRKTGVLFPQQTVASLLKVLKNFKTNRYNSIDCINNGKRFSEKIFQGSIIKVVNKYK